MGGTDGTARDEHRLEEQAGDRRRPRRMGAAVRRCSSPTSTGIAAHIGDVIFLIGGRNDAGSRSSRRSSRASSAVPTRRPTTPTRSSPSGGCQRQTNLPVAAAEHVRVHRQRRDLRPGRQRRHDPVGRDVLDHPRRRWRDPGWKNLDQTDLGQGIEGSAAVVSGSHAFLFAGRTPQGVDQRHRPHEPRAAGAVLPARPPGRDRPGASSWTARSASRSATSTPPAWAPSTSSC